MIALAIADVNPKPEEFFELYNASEPDCIFLLGDLDVFPLSILKPLAIPKFGIYGNHCLGHYLPEIGAVELHGKTVQWEGLTLGGLNGCPRYKPSGTYLYSQEEVQDLLTNFPPVDIFLSHSPPFGINDHPDRMSHQGFHGLRNYLEERPPELFLHGHTHPKGDDITTHLGPTRIEYVYGTRLIVF